MRPRIKIIISLLQLSMHLLRFITAGLLFTVLYYHQHYNLAQAHKFCLDIYVVIFCCNEHNFHERKSLCRSLFLHIGSGRDRFGRSIRSLDSTIPHWLSRPHKILSINNDTVGKEDTDKKDVETTKRSYADIVRGGEAQGLKKIRPTK